jgi:murein DD-endopeptidase MepM/ murein hydrolase activator NlpD
VRIAGGSDDARLDELEAAIGEASRAELEALARWQDAQRATTEARRALRSLRTEVTDARLDTYAADAKVDAAEATQRDMEFRLRFLRGEIADAEDDVDDVAVELYVKGGATASAAASINAESAIDASAGAAYLSVIADDRQAVVDRYGRLTRDVAALERGAREQADVARAARVDAESKLAALEALLEQRRDLHATAMRAERTAKRLYRAIKAKRVEYESAIVAAKQASNSIRTLLSATQSGQRRTRDYQLAVRPVPGAVASGFGYRVHPVLGTKRWHMGVDMNANHSDDTFAADAGVVVFAGSRDGYGNTVIVDHQNRYSTLYAHLSVIVARPGERVRAGDVVGLVGATGMATGPHLHFEVRLLGVPQDPIDFFPPET